MAENQLFDTNEPNSDTAFSDSIEAYTVSDVHNMEKGRARSQTVSLLIRSAAIAVCIGILGYSVYMIADKVISDRKANQEYEDIRVNESDLITIAHGKNLKEPNAMPTVLQMLDGTGIYRPYVPDNTITEDKATHYKNLHKNFLRIAERYENVYAWVYMTDTRVDYPVMKGTDNAFYLLHNYKGEESASGSIMADYGLSDSYYSNYNMVFYGHNMRNGSMFHSVKNWCNSANIKSLVQTTQIEIYTKEGVYIYDILSYYVSSDSRFATLSFANRDEYLSFLNSISKASLVRTNREYNADSKICTLITCTNGSEGDSRYVVHGILNQFIPF